MTPSKPQVKSADLNQKQRDELMRRLAAAQTRDEDLEEESLDEAENALQKRIAHLAFAQKNKSAFLTSWRTQPPLFLGLAAAALLAVIVWPRPSNSPSTTVKGTGAAQMCTFEIRSAAGKSIDPQGKHPPSLEAEETFLMLGRCSEEGYLQMSFSAEGSETAPLAKEFRNAHITPTAVHHPLADSSERMVGFTLPPGQGTLLITWKLTATPLEEGVSLAADSAHRSGVLSLPFGARR